jgi:hypothetical protein
VLDGEAMDDNAIHALWALLRDRAMGTLSILRSATAHPRTFVVERGARASIVVPSRITTPAERFAVLHELGHAVLWLAPSARAMEWPRAIDEAAASYVARRMEHEDVPAAWRSPLARAARVRRLAIARLLDAIEAGAAPEVERPPWALWNDPYAQAAYVEAERIADEMPMGLHGSAIGAWLAERANAIDERA